MQAEAPEEVPSPPEQNTLSQNNKRRRTTDRSTRTIPEQPESSDAPSTGRPTLTRSSPQRGSSREMTPPEGAGRVKYTRTGRVSKATKGQRVHNCEECGKTYTRAEHLRRHQQNHKPGAYPCDIPGCGRSFYREDLLIRHKARHNDPLNPPSREGSPGSQDSEPSEQSVPRRASAVAPGGIIVGDESEPVNVGPTPRNSIRQSGTRTHKGYLDINQLPRTSQQLPVTIDTNGDGYPDFAFSGYSCDPSPPYSPTGYDSPTNGPFVFTSGPPYFQPQPSRARQSSNASHLGQYPLPYTSRSPISAGSSTLNLPQWGHNAPDAGTYHFGDSSAFEAPYGQGFGIYNTHMADQPLPIPMFGSSRVLTPEDRDFMEHDDLIIPTSLSRHPSLDVSMDELPYTNEERYLGSFWLWIHPFWPVIHRPSFILQNASPLLKAAMLALGAHALNDHTDKTNARIIHERCSKVLKKRTLNAWHSYRTCDMQAIVLVEIYSIFKSRRPPLQVSTLFEDVYRSLANDLSALNPDVANDPTLQGPSTSGSTYLDDFALSLDSKCKQRLLLSCYILDQQHATLFGRPQTKHYTGAATDLPFPKSQASWDASRDLRGTDESMPSRVWEALDGGNPDEPRRRSYDVFQSMLMMACLGDSADMDSPGYGTLAGRDLSPMLSTMEQSPGIKLAYHTYMLCKHTHIEDLLAVAGESWILGKKLSLPSDYTAAQIASREWAKGFIEPIMDFTTETEQAPVNKALRHALKIQELHMNHPKTGLLFQEWSIYLASVVIWARAYVTSNRPHLGGHRLSIPTPVEPDLTPAQLEEAVKAVINAGPNSNIDIDQAKNVLFWTDASIEKVDIPHVCGLTNSARDVLGKLVARGNEEGWFGS